uniref:Uncharacterized 9.4 kDa protein in flaL 3'region n=1 Tax=Bacillus licheniformis TaxID=1402 RepID=YFL2_BACLI|nr:RecName: Full=Uncharacterized 9.4 kDa protein in flaL 3'region; AltName: Full=ORF3 [Bacillus licheniformis]AAA22440.1 putative [Bacillus licheniformis]
MNIKKRIIQIRFLNCTIIYLHCALFRSLLHNLFHRHVFCRRLSSRSIEYLRMRSQAAQNLLDICSVPFCRWRLLFCH